MEWKDIKARSVANTTFDLGEGLVLQLRRVRFGEILLRLGARPGYLEAILSNDDEEKTDKLARALDDPEAYVDSMDLGEKMEDAALVLGIAGPVTIYFDFERNPEELGDTEFTVSQFKSAFPIPVIEALTAQIRRVGKIPSSQEVGVKDAAFPEAGSTA